MGCYAVAAMLEELPSVACRHLVESSAHRLYERLAGTRPGPPQERHELGKRFFYGVEIVCVKGSKQTRSWSRGKRFESARRLSRIGISKPNTRNRGDSQRQIEGFATSSLHHGVGIATVACCEWSRGTAGGVGESSWINGQVNAPRFQTIRPGQVGFGIGRGAG